jgi:GNAT superfamily N-acetyltransferase
VRTATAADIPAVRDLERRAGEPFRAIGLPTIADDEPPAVADLVAAVDRGRITVIDGTGAGEPDLVAWLWLSEADGDLFIEQVSVDPSCRGRRLGTALIGHAVNLARAAGRPGVGLTTFRTVPWNAPLYRRLGFSELTDDELGPDLRQIRDAERAAGLDVAPRVAMRRTV